MGAATLLFMYITMPKSSAIPVPELYARPVGKFEWSCPNCGQEHPFTHYPWRRGDIQCRRCKAHFRLGVGFDNIKSSDAYIMGKFNGNTANRYHPVGTRFTGSKLYSTLEYECPICKFTQSGFIDYDNRVECSSCAKPFWVSLLIWRSTGQVKAPIDSLVNIQYAKVPNDTLAPAEVNPGAGKAI